MQLSFDIGGTFTDVVLLDESTGRTWLGKTLTTYDDLSRAVSTGISSLLEASGSEPTAIDRPVIGATTLVTNALIERSAPPTALITTRGFADLIEIGREWRYDIYDLRLRFPEPLVPPGLRLELTERLRADGAVDVPIELDELEGAVTALREADVRSVAVCFLNSYVSDVHEEMVAERLQELAPDLMVTTSSQLAPEIREYERIITAVANAYVRPIAGEHFRDIEEAFESAGVEQPLLLMQSNGGITDTRLAGRFPIRLLESGPAAGALAAAYWGRRLGVEDLMAFDMGGTTAKVCLVESGRPTLARSFEVARVHRHKRGSGMTVRVPVIELLEIGAGGGSIAALDDVGLLGVGPRSAGSEPGPACYGRGGAKPTVTDADLALGYLDPDYFLGGRMRLDPDAARAVIEAELADGFGGDPREAAIGIVTVVEESMAAAMRIHATEHGRDPSDYAVLAFGGAAPVHAVSVSRRLGVSEVIIPASAGVLSAGGLQVAPPITDVVRTRIMPVAGWNPGEVASICHDLRAQALEQLGPMAGDRVTFQVSADMRFRGQGFEVEVSLPQLVEVAVSNGAGPVPDAAEADRLFRDRYEQLRGSVPPAGEAEVVAWRLSAVGEWEEPSLQARSEEHDGEGAAVVGKRDAWFPSTGVTEATIYDHLALKPGDSGSGPAIVQQPESTAVIGPDDSFTVDEHLNLRVSVGKGEPR
ncbi:MAG: hydantoinase/oxoprolinase family protein [Actinobacteria bacterium]|nr:hydantoinase/oxoprolinase family protein [Actinomycetota bacterium]